MADNTKIENQLDSSLEATSNTSTTPQQQTVEATWVQAEPEIQATTAVAPELIENREQAQEQVIQTQQDAIENTKEIKENLESDAQQRIEEDKQAAEEAIKSQEEFTETQQDLIKQKDEDIAAIQEEIDRKNEERAKRDVAAINREAEDAKKLNDLALELQKRKDEETIMNAKKAVELEKQKSAWSFNKLGLGFSNGIIVQAQQIATEWATRLATLQVQANFNQTKLKIEANKVQAEYSRQVNGVIDKYVDIQLQNDQDIIERIDETNNNLLLSQREKQLKIEEIKREWRENKRQTEDNLKNDQIKLSDKLISQTEKIEERFRLIQEEGKQQANIRIDTWELSRMMPQEIVKLEEELGLPVGTLKTQETTKIQVATRNIYDNLIGRDYNISNMEEIISDTRTQMRQGKTLNEAITFAINEELKTNPDFQRQKRLKAAEQQAKMNKALGIWGAWATAWAQPSQAERDAFLEAGWKSSDLKNLIKTGWLPAATQALRRKNKAFQEAATVSLDKLAKETWAFQWEEEARDALLNTLDALEKAWYSSQETIDLIQKETETIVEVDEDNQEIRFLNDSLGGNELFHTIKF